MREPFHYRRPLWLPNRFSPGCGCCGSTGEPCNQCNSGTTPANIVVAVPTLTNGLCTSCASMAGNYTLPQSPGASYACQFYLRLTSGTAPACFTHQFPYTLQGIDLNLYIYANRVQFSMTWSYSATVWDRLTWYTLHTAPIDCDFSSYSLTFQHSQQSGGVSAVCTNPSNTAVLITAA